MTRTLFVFSLLALGVGLVHCYPQGPPATRAEVCKNVTPGTDSPHELQEGNGDYFISTNISYNETSMYYEYTAGESYIVQLQSTSNEFEGFLVQARDPSDTTIGTFATTNSAQQVLHCQIMFPSIANGSTIGHSNKEHDSHTESTIGHVDEEHHDTRSTIGHSDHYMVQNFTWTAPSSDDGFVTFLYTVLREEDEYFGPINAGEQIQMPLAGAGTIVEEPTMDNAAIAVTAPLLLALFVCMALFFKV